ncbi:MAG: LPS assembly protein LptD [Arsenophonus sp.]|nr:MAG: LPS assembly protein LptD [Arsenophonus sp.]
MKKKNKNIILFVIGFLITILSKQIFSSSKNNLNLSPNQKKNKNSIPIYITAKEIESKYPNYIRYKKNVKIQKKDMKISSDDILIMEKKINEKKKKIIIAKNNVTFSNKKILLKGNNALINLNDNVINIKNSHYQMNNKIGHGQAKKIEINKNYIYLNHATFSSCPNNRNDWKISGSKITFNHNNKTADIFNAKFYIKNTPILYIPYLKFPIFNKRRSGFLFLKSDYTHYSGINFSIPFYWNIDSNYNASIIPQLSLSNGLKLNNKLNYLTKLGKGTVIFDWLPIKNGKIIKKENNIFKKIKNDNLDDRWFFSWNHSGIINKTIKLNTEYSKVSDFQYFDDFYTKKYHHDQKDLKQKFNLSYTNSNWNISLGSKKIENYYKLSDNYSIYPHFNIDYHQYNIQPFYIKIHAEASQIKNTTNNDSKITRFNIDPEINFKIFKPWININNSIKIISTNYNKKPSIKTIKKQIFNKKNMFPIFKTDVKLTIKNNLFIKNNKFIQSLEPYMQFLYIPYQKRSTYFNENNFLEEYYQSIYYYNIISGLDLMLPVNQINTGFMTRIYNKKLTEIFNFSFGQKYDFYSPQTKLCFDKNQRILWTGIINFNLTNQLGINSTFQYDKSYQNIIVSNISTKYHLNPNNSIQLTYRFVDYNYLYQKIKNNIFLEKKNISQLGGTIHWNIMKNWDIAGSYFFNTSYKKITNQSIMLKYHTPCWSIKIGQELNKKYNQLGKNSFDNKWSINIELKNPKKYFFN